MSFSRSCLLLKYKKCVCLFQVSVSQRLETSKHIFFYDIKRNNRKKLWFWFLVAGWYAFTLGKFFERRALLTYNQRPATKDLQSKPLNQRPTTENQMIPHFLINSGHAEV